MIDKAVTNPALPFRDEARRTTETTVVAALVRRLHDWGVEQAFGVSGGAIAIFFDEVATSPITLHHFRHETGAAFAATEAHFTSGRPTVVFCTTGPGLVNALAGMKAAQAEGAKVILVSGATGSRQLGRWATQETGPFTLPVDALYGHSTLFDDAVRVEDAAELPGVFRRLERGLMRPGGYTAHVALPMALLTHRLELPEEPPEVDFVARGVSPRDADRCADLLCEGPFAVWVGHGARGAAPLVKALVERTGAQVFSSPRGKGVFSEKHPQFVGVTGVGGHDAVRRYMSETRPGWVLVLGTRLGETTSLWDPALTPTRGFIHVDVDPGVPGTAYPECRTVAVEAEVGEFLGALLERLPERPPASAQVRSLETAPRSPMPSVRPGAVRAEVLMATIQRRVVETGDVPVMSEGGVVSAWCNHRLRFDRPGAYRTGSYFGGRGQAIAGAVGAALARRGKVLSLCGEEAFLGGSEVSTAVQYQAPAVWLVMNRGGRSERQEAHEALGLSTRGMELPLVDYVRMARALGADGEQVDDERDLDAALGRALVAPGPFVLDVRVDPASPAHPLMVVSEDEAGPRPSV